MATGDLSYPYDVRFTITGEDSIGFMLSIPEDATKQITIQESDPPRYDRDIDEFSEIFRTSNPRNDTPYVINDLSGGVGQSYLDDGDPNKYWWSSGVITHVKGKAFPAPPVTSLSLTVSAVVTEALKKVYTATITGTGEKYDLITDGDKIWRRRANDSSTAWEQVYDFTGFTINGMYHYNNDLYLFGSGAGTGGFYVIDDITAAATWSPILEAHSTSMANVNGNYDGVAIGNTFYIRTAHSGTSGSRIYFNTTPRDDAWTGPTVVGPDLSGWGINRMIAVNNFLFIMNDFAIYSMDADQNIIEVVWQWKDNPNPDNFKYHAAYNSELVFNVRNELYSYNPIEGTVFKLGFSGKDGFSVEQITGLASDQNFVYVLARVKVPIIRSADSWALFAGHNHNGIWEWEVLWEETTDDSGNDQYKFHHLTASSDETESLSRLYWIKHFPNGTTSNTYIQEIPWKWDYSDDDSFDTSVELYTSITKSRFPGFIKMQSYLDGNFLNLDANNTIEIQYSIDNGNTYTSLITANEDREIIDYSNVSGYTLGLRFIFTSDGTTAPILLDTTSHQRIRFLFLPFITLSIRVANQIALRDNNYDSRKVWDVWDDLTTLRSSETDILYEDYLGNQFPVTVDVLTLTTVKNDSADRVELEATLVITRKDKGD